MSSLNFPPLKLIVLISGNGSNLQAVIDAINEKRLNAKIACVISNNENAFGLTRAKNSEITTKILSHKNFQTREQYDQELLHIIDGHKPDIIVLAGFMRILSPLFINKYRGRILNIHPSLLPKFPGLNTHERALAEKEKHHGVTIHIVTEDLDGGPIIAQSRLEIHENDTAESLQKRIHQLEHQLYPCVLQWFAEHRIQYDGNTISLDGKVLPEQGMLVELK